MTRSRTGWTPLLLLLAGCGGAGAAMSDGGSPDGGGVEVDAGAPPADGGTLYHCTVGHFRNGGGGGTPICPTAGCADPFTGISGDGSFCQQFDLVVDGSAVTWVGCFTCDAAQTTLDESSCTGGPVSSCQAQALTCVPAGHVTNPTDAGFIVTDRVPGCGASLGGTHELWVGFPQTFNALCVADGFEQVDAGPVNVCQ